MSKVSIEIEWIKSFRPGDLDTLCEATEKAIQVGLGFDWIKTPKRLVIERYWQGVLLVPDRELLIGRLNGIIAGTAQMVKPPMNNEAGFFNVVMTSFFVAPWARGHGMARDMLVEFEKKSKKLGFTQISLDVRETQDAAITLYERAGYTRWGLKEKYARVDGQYIKGLYYSKDISL